MKIHVEPADLESRQPTIRRLFIFIAVCVIAPASLFVHDYMLETLKVPYPKVVGLPGWVKFVNEVVRLFALASICRLSRPRLLGISRGMAAIAAGLLLVMLYETLRVFFIEGAILGSLLYSAYDRVSEALCLFAGGSAVAWIALGDLKRLEVAGLIVVIAAILVYLVHPGLDWLVEPLKNGIPGISELYTDPYPFKMNVLIYVTFLEPTIAAFVAVSFCWPALPGGLLRRTLTFAALLLLIRSRFVQLFIQSFWIELPRPVAFLAVGQFFLETLVLGVLTALAWNHADRSARRELDRTNS